MVLDVLTRQFLLTAMQIENCESDQLIKERKVTGDNECNYERN